MCYCTSKVTLKALKEPKQSVFSVPVLAVYLHNQLHIYKKWPEQEHRVIM